MIRKLFAAIAVCLLTMSPVASHADDVWTKPGVDGKPEVQLYFFWSLTCPHCTELFARALGPVLTAWMIDISNIGMAIWIWVLLVLLASGAYWSASRALLLPASLSCEKSGA